MSGPVFFSVAVSWVADSSAVGSHRLIATCYTCGAESPAFDYLADSNKLPGWLVEHRRSHTAPILTQCPHFGVCKTPRHESLRAHEGPCTFICTNSRCRKSSPHAGECDLEYGR